MSVLNERDVELLKICQREGVAPFKGDLPNWTLVSSFVGRSNNALGKQYRRIKKRCAKAGTDIGSELYRVESGNGKAILTGGLSSDISGVIMGVVQSGGGMLRENVVLSGDKGCEVFVPYTDGEDLKIGDVDIVASGSNNTNPIDQMAINAGLDPKRFEIKKGKMWGNPLKPMVSGTFERKLPEGKVFDDLMLKVSDIITSPIVRKTYPTTNNTMAMFALYDAHLNKLSTTGSGLFNTADLYKEVLIGLVDKVIRYGGAKRANFVIGQDFAHNTIHNQTSAGTPQDVSQPFKIAVDTQVEVALWSIELLRGYFEEVEIVIVRGNHSEESSYFLGVLIDTVYKGVDNVTVDNSHSSQKASSWGNNGYFYIHGDKIPPQRRALLFASMYPKIFANSSNKTIFSGHLHSRKTDVNMISETHGIVQRQMSSLSSDDNWHEKSGYVLNKRMGSVLLYDFDKGLDAEFYYTIK